MTKPSPPRLSLPDDIKERLDEYRSGFAEELESRIRGLPRPCVYFRSHRVGPSPLRGSLIGRLMGKPPAAPALSAVASKFGGTPYAESDEPWHTHRFLGQIDLAEATEHLPDRALRGLIRLDIPEPGYGETFEDGVRLRWFPDPSEAKAVPTPGARAYGKWETRIEFKPGWSLPHNQRSWFALLPKTLDDLWDFWNEFPYTVEGCNEDAGDEHHTLLGWPAGGLDEHYGFNPAPGASADVADYEMLLCITYDNAAGFGWGTNWLYVIVPREDLATGNLSRICATGANS